MSFTFEIINKEDINLIIPLVEKLNDYKISKSLLEERFSEMITQNYECAGVFDKNILIGVCGMWFCTRHYVGKSIELDHVFIEKEYRGQGVGKHFLAWIYEYAKNKNCKTIELNTYVQNSLSHKFYFNEGFEILGYHFLKKL